MRDLAELNINSGGRPVTRPSPSKAAVEDFQREFRVSIPSELLALLQFANGGHPELDSYNPNGSEDANSFAVNCFYFLTEDREADYSLWQAIRTWRPYIGPNALPFAEDGGGNILFLDLSSDPPPVKVCWHDENFKVGEMTPSLEALVDGLCENPDYI